MSQQSPVAKIYDDTPPQKGGRGRVVLYVLDCDGRLMLTGRVRKTHLVMLSVSVSDLERWQQEGRFVQYVLDERTMHTENAA